MIRNTGHSGSRIQFIEFSTREWAGGLCTYHIGDSAFCFVNVLFSCVYLCFWFKEFHVG